MDIAEIKEKLPSVKIKLNGIVIRGGLSGRKLPYARVYIPAAGVHYHKRYDPQSWQFSWEAVAGAINTDTALII